MPYQELHFNSAIFSDKVKYVGTRNKRTLELNNPIHINKFHVKDLELPLTWCNVPEGTFTIHFAYFDNTNAPVWDGGYLITVPAGCHTGESFAAALDAGLAAAEVATQPLTSNMTVNFVDLVDPDNAGKLEFTVPSAVHTDVITANPTADRFQVTIFWPDAWRKILARNWETDVLILPGVIDEFPADLTLTSASLTFHTLYQIRLIPNSFYLNSNLMSATPWNSTMRAIGAFASNTIVTRVQINPAYQWKEQIMPWVNPQLDHLFMYDCHGSEFNQIEFWFTDETGAVLDLLNTNFSLTLAIFTP